MAFTHSSRRLLPLLSILFAVVSSTPYAPKPSFTYLGCFTDDEGTRGLNGSSAATDEMTIGKCAAFCWKLKYSLFGLENGRQCYCGYSLADTSLEVDASECSAICWGNGAQGCGALNRLSLYTLLSPVVLPPASSTTTDSSTSSSPTSDAQSETPTAPTDLSSTSAEDTSTSIEVSATSTKTSTDAPTTSVEATTTEEAVTDTTSDQASTSLTERSSSIPSSTTVTLTSTTTEGPALTTITDCPAIPTYAGTPELCYYPKLNTACDKLTSAFQYRMMSQSLNACSRYLTLYGMTANAAAKACFPTSTAAIPANSAVATSTMRKVWSCLQTASLLCTMDSSCVTGTYTAGQVPTPTPSIGVDLLKDGGFESGNLGAWTTSGFNQDLTGEVSTGRPHTGSYSYHIYFPNTNGISGSLTRTIRVEPGRQYTFKLSYYHENPAAYMSLYLYVLNAGAQTDYNSAKLTQTTANQWLERSVTFTATTSWLQLQVSPGGNVGGTNGEAAYRNNVWIDDITLTRLN